MSDDVSNLLLANAMFGRRLCESDHKVVTSIAILSDKCERFPVRFLSRFWLWASVLGSTSERTPRPASREGTSIVSKPDPVGGRTGFKGANTASPRQIRLRHPTLTPTA